MSTLRETYDSIAAGFAARYADIPADLVPLMVSVSDHVGTSGLILDVGCGHGRDMAWFAARDNRVVGFDLSLAMLREAQGPRLQADMTQLPIRDGAADAVWCNAALLHLPKTIAPLALNEFHRALKPDGLLVVTVQRGSHDGPRRNETWNVTRHFSDYEPDEITEILEGVGFVVRTTSQSEGPTVTWVQTLSQRGRYPR